MIISLFSLSFLSILYVIFYIFKEINFMIYIVIAMYTYSLFLSYKYIERVGVLFFYNLSFGFFYINRLFLSCISKNYIWEIAVWKYYIFSIPTQKVMLNSLFIYIGGIILGILIYMSKGKEYLLYKEFKHKRNYKLEKISKIGFYICLIPAIYKIYLQIKYISINSYISIYNGGILQLQYPRFIGVALWLVGIFYVLYCISYPTKKNFLKISILYTLFNVIQSLKGGRASLVIGVLYPISLYIIMYRKKINIKKICLVLAPLLLLFKVIGDIRSKNTSDTTSGIGEFIYEQGVTLSLLGTNYDFYNIIKQKEYKYLFAPFLSFFDRIFYPEITSLPSENLIKLTPEFSNIMSYILSKESYLAGYGVGGSSLVELYNFGGYTFLLLGGILTATICTSIEYTNLKSGIKFILICYFLKTIYLSPRVNYFIPVIELQYALVTILLYKFFNIIILTIEKGVKDEGKKV